MLSTNELPQNKLLLLGEILEQAGLVSDEQIQIALAERRESHNLRVGEILALRGWIEQRTADFFADEWCNLVNQPEKQLFGYYLEKSGLLTKQETNSILEEQKRIWVKFGAIAVLQGLLTKETVDFFLEHLFPLELLESSLIGRKINQQATKITAQVANSAQKLPEQQSSFPQADDDDIPWIG
ncbi:MAG: hypothetical protein HC930_10385 [Hydrococcus sp. SU_1_0]|nr:hypothetical protein [Hydrococcus sp. SU_1_0]